jgi:hypothetical protein
MLPALAHIESLAPQDAALLRNSPENPDLCQRRPGQSISGEIPYIAEKK